MVSTLWRVSSRTQLCHHLPDQVFSDFLVGLEQDLVLWIQRFEFLAWQLWAGEQKSVIVGAQCFGSVSF